MIAPFSAGGIHPAQPLASNVVATSAGEQAAIEPARAELLGHGPLATPVGHLPVRPVIEQSWRRCEGENVPAEEASIPYLDCAEQESPLRRAAAPVLARLGEQLSDVRVALFLSDAEGHIVMRWAGERRQRSVLDNACAAEGFDYSEGGVGTNGLGTVISQRIPVVGFRRSRRRLWRARPRRAQPARAA